MAVLAALTEMGMDYSNAKYHVSGTNEDLRKNNGDPITYLGPHSRRSLMPRTAYGNSDDYNLAGQIPFYEQVDRDAGIIWVHFLGDGHSITSDDDKNNGLVEIRDTTGRMVFGISRHWYYSTTQWYTEFNITTHNDSGSRATTQLAASNTSGRIHSDIALDFVNNTATLYLNGAKVAVKNCDLNRATKNPLAEARIYAMRFYDSESAISELIITQGEPTIGWRLATLAPDSLGTINTFASGDHSSINEVNFNPNTYLETDSTATATFTYTDLPSSPEHVVRGVTIKTTATSDIGGNTIVEDIIRVGGVVHTIGSTDFETSEFTKDSNRLVEKNPDTGEDWLESEVNSAQFGVNVRS